MRLFTGFNNFVDYFGVISLSSRSIAIEKRVAFLLGVRGLLHLGTFACFAVRVYGLESFCEFFETQSAIRVQVQSPDDIVTLIATSHVPLLPEE